MFVDYGQVIFLREEFIVRGPMTTISKKKSPAFSSLLQKKIKTLSMDTKFHKFPKQSFEEDLVMKQREESEQYFQRAVAERIWWRLSAQERKEIRMAVQAVDPLREYKKDWSSDRYEWDCLREIRRILGGC